MGMASPLGIGISGPDARRSGRWPRKASAWIRGLVLLGLLWALGAVVGPLHAEEEGVHVVQRGESLSAIARRYQVDPVELARRNGIADPNRIYVGQRLIIPASPLRSTGPGYYTVRPGDTLSGIARRHGLALDDLVRLNGLTDPDRIAVGQRLRVSARVAPVAIERSPERPTMARTIHRVRAGESLDQIAAEYGVTVYQLLAANGLPHPDLLWPGQRLRIPRSSPRPLADPPALEEVKWIEVNLSHQTLTAWQGERPVLSVPVSTGTSATPTVTGRFRIYTKRTSQTMSGPGYYLPDVPWVMYFYQGYAIHGTYWHNNFGVPMSHGCVNMRIPDAEWLFRWAPQGTLVYVHY